MANIEHKKPDHGKEDELVVKSQLIIFVLALVLAWFVGPFLPATGAEVVYKLVDMLFICGTILLAIKLAREGWDMAAAGFTILGIGWGVIFAATDFHHLKIDMEVRTSAAYFFIPCMLLISYYKPFPVWLKLLTISCMVPYVICMVVQKIDPHNESLIFTWLSIAFGIFHLTSVIWGIFFYRQFRRGLR